MAIEHTSLAVLLAAIATMGCGRTIRRVPETVTPHHHGFWVAGSEGFAAFIDDSGPHPRDYPLSDDAPDWSYEPGYDDIAAARIVIVDDTALLVTRVGDFFAWSGDRWDRLPIKVGGEMGGTPQINRALLAPDRTLILHVHGQTLLSGSLQRFLSHEYRADRLPTYFTWMGFAGPALYGLGWDDQGEVRALHRRDGAAWTQVVRLGRDALFGEPKCVLPARDGHPVVVLQHAIFDPTPAARDLPTKSFLPILDASTTVAEQIARDTGRLVVSKCLMDGGGAALIVLYGASADQPNVLVYDHGSMSAWRCPDSWATEAIGAFEQSRRWTVVTSGLEVSALPGSACNPAPTHEAAVIADG